jgi:hypothetical protein
MGATLATGPTGRSPRRPWTRRAAWWTALLVVLLGHALATLWLQDNLVGWGAGEKPMPQRIEVAFVQVLTPAAPPPAPAAAARPARKPARARTAAPAASAASAAEAVEAAASAPEPEPQAAAVVETPVAVADAASAVPPAPEAASAVVAAASAPAGAPAFEWPPSTRLTYRLTGNYRGEVNGTARVQWVREGARYQVHLDVVIGPSFAPLISRRMTSDGELGEQGLVPRRYDEATRLLFGKPRRATLLFSPEQVTLANGSTRESLPGVQDAASQFVQLTWLFTTRPELLSAGNTVTMPLALPRRMGRWVFDVIGQERLVAPFGELDTFHLRPRLAALRSGAELSAEVWFAPTLQYLPVRLRIQQDAENFIDLMIEAPPLQAAPERAASAPG